ncbi:hypothetical protein C8R45DRAFT_849140, partial [Mycena sanguinolenta]
MLRLATKFHLKLDALALAKDVKEELPIFFHVGGNKEATKHNNSACAKCLRDKHGARSTGDMLGIVERNYLRHSRRSNCACAPCREDRQNGCEKPYRCQEEAIKILACLHEKWDPRLNVKQPNPELSTEEKEGNLNAFKENEIVTFDPAIKLNRLVDGFRIF